MARSGGGRFRFKVCAWEDRSRGERSSGRGGSSGRAMESSRWEICGARRKESAERQICGRKQAKQSKCYQLEPRDRCDAMDGCGRRRSCPFKSPGPGRRARRRLGGTVFDEEWAMERGFRKRSGCSLAGTRDSSPRRGPPHTPQTIVRMAVQKEGRKGRGRATA